MTDQVTVATYPFRSDAEIGKARLAADGIRSAVKADNEGGLNPGFYKEYGVRLEVADSDLDDALDSLGIERVEVPRPIAEAIYRHATSAYPNEACGLIAVDDGGELVFAACLTNADKSRHRFTIDPHEHHGMVRLCDQRGWTIGALFHSHPASEPYPSPSDLDGGGDPEWLHLLIGPMNGRSELKGYRFEGEQVTEVSVTIGA
ncbi:MAG: Mov34/MPN/PAD-1 family protein [Acidimicrobiia bacterium]